MIEGKKRVNGEIWGLLPEVRVLSPAMPSSALPALREVIEQEDAVEREREEAGSPLDLAKSCASHT